MIQGSEKTIYYALFDVLSRANNPCTCASIPFKSHHYQIVSLLNRLFFSRPGVNKFEVEFVEINSHSIFAEVWLECFHHWFTNKSTEMIFYGLGFGVNTVQPEEFLLRRAQRRLVARGDAGRRGERPANI